MSIIKGTQNSLSKDSGFVSASIDLDRPAEICLVKKVNIPVGKTVLEAREIFKAEYKEFLDSENSNFLQDFKETLGSKLLRNNNKKAIRLEFLTKVVLKEDSLNYDFLSAPKLGTEFRKTGVYLDINGFSVLNKSEAVYEVVVNSKYLNIYIVPAIDITRENYILTSKNNSQNGLADITDISVEIGVYSFSTANFSLKNDLEKYEFVTDPLKKGKSVFSADDIVVIRLPGIDYGMVNKDLLQGLETSFVGYVNDIRRLSKPASNTINITCEGMTKRLRFSRAITKQALNSDDAQAVMMPISAFSYPFSADVANASELVKNLVISSVTDINETKLLKELINEFNIEFEKYNSYEDKEKLTNRGTENSKKIKELRDKIDNIKKSLLSSYYTSVADSNNESDIEVYTNNSKILPILGGYKLPICLVFGTSQKAYKLIFGQWEMWLAEWSQVNKLIQEMADTVNFAFYDSENGIIKFEQLNVSIEHLKKSVKSKISSYDSALTTYNKKNDSIRRRSAFWIKDIWIKDKSVLDGTSEIQNIITVVGSAVMEGQPDWNKFGARATIKNNRLIKKHGPIMGNPQTVLNLRTSQACFCYGKALLDRMNRKASSNAVVRLVGNANLKVGSYCYLESENSLYYIEKISHSLSIGGSYDTQIELSYKREPVLRIDEDTAPWVLSRSEKSDNKTLNFIKIKDKLNAENGFNNIFNNSERKRYLIIQIKKKMLDLGYTEKEIESVYTVDSLKFLYFNGFIWEHTIETDFSSYAERVYEQMSKEAKIAQEAGN